MGQIIDFNLRKGNLSSISFYNISRDNIFKGIISDIDVSKPNFYNDLDNYKFIKVEEKLNSTINNKLFIIIY